MNYSKIDYDGMKINEKVSFVYYVLYGEISLKVILSVIFLQENHFIGMCKDRTASSIMNVLNSGLSCDSSILSGKVPQLKFVKCVSCGY